MNAKDLTRILILVFCAFAGGGCRYVGGTLPVAVARPNTQKTLIAGAAKIDITPMPGFPMAAFGPGNRYSRGVWTRLWARATYLEDAEGHAIVWVACDLWSMPGGLANRVAELLYNKYGDVHMGREQIALAATHTHTSPGAFSTCTAHNALASNDHGFSLALFHWMSERIAFCIHEAISAARPAAATFGADHIADLARNRSFRAFISNGADAEELIKESVDAGIITKPTPFPVEVAPGREADDAYRAFDRRLRVLYLREAAGGAPIAVVAFAGLHPTAMGGDTEVYTSDLFGLAALNVENKLNYPPGAPALARPAIVSIYNTSEGDVVANWARHDRNSARKIGDELAQRIGNAMRDAEAHPVNGNITYNGKYVDLAARHTAAIGAPMPGGAEGDATFLADAGAWEGLTGTREVAPGHGNKLLLMAPWFRDGENSGAAKFYTGAAGAALNVPEGAWVSVFKLGNITIATLPGEFTTILARRMEKQIRGAAGGGEVILMGLANEYLSYFTTCEEYKLQQYEAASMLYGPESAKTIESEICHIASELAGGPRRVDPAGYFHRVAAGPGMKTEFGVDTFRFPGAATDRLHSSYDALETVLITKTHGIAMPNHPHFAWLDGNPEFPAQATGSARVTPAVSVQVSECKDSANGPPAERQWKDLMICGIPENDENGQFVTHVIVERHGSSRWMTHWLRPLDASAAELAEWNSKNRVFRFRVEGFRGIYYSAEFKIPEILEEKGQAGFAWDPAENYKE